SDHHSLLHPPLTAPPLGSSSPLPPRPSLAVPTDAHSRRASLVSPLSVTRMLERSSIPALHRATSRETLGGSVDSAATTPQPPPSSHHTTEHTPAHFHFPLPVTNTRRTCPQGSQAADQGPNQGLSQGLSD